MYNGNRRLWRQFAAILKKVRGEKRLKWTGEVGHMDGTIDIDGKESWFLFCFVIIVQTTINSRITISHRLPVVRT